MNHHDVCIAHGECLLKALYTRISSFALISPSTGGDYRSKGNVHSNAEHYGGNIKPGQSYYSRQLYPPKAEHHVQSTLHS